jgi:hypothetical protein
MFFFIVLDILSQQLIMLSNTDSQQIIKVKQYWVSTGMGEGLGWGTTLD